MSRINFLLLIAVLLSGLYMVRNAYEARRLFTELDRAQTEARRLDADYQRLQAERHAQATNLRVEQVARERLRMRAITPAITQPVAQPLTQAVTQPLDAADQRATPPASGARP
ncbi:cell division protein FtsL [Paucibacter soli]|uniref:cell division protein FtsL n=1 Tax=Paucibacter soli TaxID=3133433 RepID=UPI0030A73C95